jgi:hypothetical protein
MRSAFLPTALSVLIGMLSSQLATANSPAPTAAEIKAKLGEFHSNPKRFMNRRVPKKDENGQIVSEHHRFPLDSVNPDGTLGGDFVDYKGLNRPQTLEGRAAYSSVDNPANLVDTLKLKTLAQMEKAYLLGAALDETPWSDDYWPLYAGVLAKRYADPKFPGGLGWKRKTDYILKNLGSAGDLNQLSPAEKYDLLVGDGDWTMTKAMIDEGRRYWEETKKVETWMGICHGWAPAAYMLPRPKNAVQVTAADGKTQLTFFPSDIKALSSSLWAHTNVPTRFMGGRCNVKKPKEDENGRVLDETCNDTNPGAWHLTVVNQIGVAKRSFVMDATYDMEVWNQPIYSYSYTYFNPQTLETTDRLSSARIALTDYKRDKFKTYRAPETKFVVGVSMNVTYSVEVEPSHALTDSPQNDGLNTVNYMYDLELNADGEIIGGEWYTNLHPDFLWTPEKGEEALSIGDTFLDSQNDRSKWNGTDTVPALWQKAATRASQEGQPLARIVKGLLEAANGGKKSNNRNTR